MKHQLGRAVAFITVVVLGTAFLFIVAVAERPTPSAVEAAKVDAISAALVPQPQFTFAVISDTHITPPPDPNRKSRAWGDLHNPNTRRAIRQINAYAPAFVVNCGDVINSFPGLPQYPAECVEAKEMMGELKPDVHITFGNHDTGNKKSFPRAKWANKMANPACGNICPENLAYFRERFGKDFYSWDHDGCHFIVLDSQLFESGLPDEEEQWRFLTRDLEQSKGARHLFAFFHQPPFWSNPNESGKKYYEIVDNPARLRLLDLLDRYGARVIFTGHTHWPIVGRYKDILLYTLPSTAFQRNFSFYGQEVRYPAIDPVQVGYAFVRVYEDRVAVERVLTHAPLPSTMPVGSESGDSRARLMAKMAADAEDNLIAVNAPLPEMKAGIWGIDGINDGRLPAPGVDPSLTTWSSAGAPSANSEEWIAIQFPEASKIDTIEVVPRGNGPERSGAFPEDFDVQVSKDGQQWTTVASKRGYPAPKGAIPQRFTFEPVEALAIRFRATKLRMANMPNTYYCQLAEMRASLGDGPNLALAAHGATVTASSCVSGVTKRRNDLDWLSALECGAKWLRLPPVTAWDRVETRKGEYYADPMLDQAFASANGWGVRLVVTLTTTNPLYPTAADRREAFAEYCRRIVQRYRGRVGAWALTVDTAKAPADECAEALATLAGVLKKLDPGAKLMLADIPLGNALYAKQLLANRAAAGAVDIVAVLSERPTGATDAAMKRYQKQAQQFQRALRDVGCQATLWCGDLSNWLAAGTTPVVSDEQKAEGLLFYCSFDETQTADYARGDGKARRKRQSDTRFVHPGAGNSFGAIAVEAPDSLTYAREGNLDPQRGTIALWVKPLKPLDDDQNHVLFALGEQDGPCIELWKTGLHNDLRFRVALAPGKLADAAAPVAGKWPVGEWRRVVSRWDCEKGAISLQIGDAPAAKASFEPGRFEGLPARFDVGCTTGGSQAQAVVDELRIYGSPAARVPPVPDPLAASDALVKLVLLNDQLGVISSFDVDSGPGGMLTIAGNPRYPLYALRACATALSAPDVKAKAFRARIEQPAKGKCELRSLPQRDGSLVIAFWATDADEPAWVRITAPFEGRARALGVDPQGFMIEELSVESDGKSVTCEVLATRRPRLLCIRPA